MGEISGRAARVGGIPTARNVDHVAFTVPDLDEAVAFFVDVLGCEYVYKVGPTEDPDGDWMERRLNVHPRASLRFVMLRCGPNLNVELYEWDAPDQNTAMPKNSDHAGRHVAIYVDDIDAAHRYLRGQRGVKVLDGPQEVPGGPIAGTRWFYFLTPWGMQMEVVSYGRLPYEATTSARQYGPAPGWRGHHGEPRDGRGEVGEG